MKDAAHLRLPSWPSRVLFLHRSRRGAANDDDDKHSNSAGSGSGSSPEDTDLEANKNPAMVRTEPAYHRLQSPDAPVKPRSRFRQRKVRWALFSFVLFGTITIILLSTLLSRHAVGGIDTLFKKTCQISLSQGKYLGQVLGPSSSSPRAIEAFLGIPYAKSTAGENRFRPPQALDTRNETDSDVVYHALKYGLICPQGKPRSDGQGENCLNVNIYRPHFGDDEASAAAEAQRLSVDRKKLPVVVYVHGGGFNMGSGKERNMASFAAFADSPIVAISFNYRVGPFGFLPSAVTAKEGLLNLGLKDQQFFFEWMRANLPDIGGDPDNVTVMGLSAGSHSIGHHLISYAPANKLSAGPPPFQKAIIESGGATARATFVPDHPLHEQQLQEFLMQCGIYGVSDDELFDKLRSLPYDTLLSAAQVMWSTWSATLRWPFQPVIDGSGGVIPDLPINSLQKGNVLRIPILTGFNTNEGAIFVPEYMNNASAVRTLMTSIVPALNTTDIEKLDELYPDVDTTEGKALYVTPRQTRRFGTQFWRLDDAYAHYAYICPVLQTATFASTTDNAPPVYVYHFAARSADFGAADHSDETPIVAHDMGEIKRFPGLVATADAMTGAWTRFAATGDPNLSHSGAKANFTWPQYTSPFGSDPDKRDPDAGRLALFGEGNDERMTAAGTHSRGTPAQVTALTSREMAECDYWWPRVVLSEGWADGSASLTPRKNDTIKARL